MGVPVLSVFVAPFVPAWLAPVCPTPLAVSPEPPASGFCGRRFPSARSCRYL